jgi:hypothetical protein
MTQAKQQPRHESGRLFRSIGFGLSQVCLAAALIGCAGAGPKNRNVSLIRAAEKGETQEMVSLIRDGADINAVDAEGWTPYLAASSNGHLEAMRVLRALGASTNAPELEAVARCNMVR